MLKFRKDFKTYLLKFISLVICILFLYSSPVYSTHTSKDSYFLRLPLGTNQIYERMQERDNEHNRTIDKFIQEHAGQAIGLLDRELSELLSDFNRDIEDSGANQMLERLNQVLAATKGRIQVIFVNSEDELPEFEGEKVWEHAGTYITVFALRGEEATKEGRRTIIGRIFHGIRARSHRPDQPLEEFEEINLAIEDQIIKYGQIVALDLKREFAKLDFPERLDIMDRDYTESRGGGFSHALAYNGIDPEIQYAIDLAINPGELDERRGRAREKLIMDVRYEAMPPLFDNLFFDYRIDYEREQIGSILTQVMVYLLRESRVGGQDVEKAIVNPILSFIMADEKVRGSFAAESRDAAVQRLAEHREGQRAVNILWSDCPQSSIKTRLQELWNRIKSASVAGGVDRQVPEEKHVDPDSILTLYNEVCSLENGSIWRERRAELHRLIRDLVKTRSELRIGEDAIFRMTNMVLWFVLAKGDESDRKDAVDKLLDEYREDTPVLVSFLALIFPTDSNLWRELKELLNRLKGSTGSVATIQKPSRSVDGSL